MTICERCGGIGGAHKTRCPWHLERVQGQLPATALAPLSGGDARTQPTDGERETAINALGYRGRKYGEIPGSFVYHVDAVAQALADQRARYERIADERAAEALEQAAAWLDKDAPDTTSADISWEQDVADEDTAMAWCQSSLRDRAASLRAASRGDGAK